MEPKLFPANAKGLEEARNHPKSGTPTNHNSIDVGGASTSKRMSIGKRLVGKKVSVHIDDPMSFMANES